MSVGSLLLSPSDGAEVGDTDGTSLATGTVGSVVGSAVSVAVGSAVSAAVGSAVSAASLVVGPGLPAATLGCVLTVGTALSTLA